MTYLYSATGGGGGNLCRGGGFVLGEKSSEVVDLGKLLSSVEEGLRSKVPCRGLLGTDKTEVGDSS